MKKLFFTIGIALLAISCSSEDKEEDNNPTLNLRQAFVDYTVSVDELKLRFGSFKTANITSNEGRSGLKGYFDGEKYLIFDACCPLEWEEGVSYQEFLTGFTYREKISLYCPICESVYDAATLKPIEGKAKREGYSLVQYKIELNKEKQEYHITNPNYKGI